MKKTATIALAGRPSVGKSTFINMLCEAKVAIVSPSPQTTRNAIRGIVNNEKGQLIIIDTPGRHNSEKKFNKKLMDTSDRAIKDSDLVIYMLDVSRKSGPEEIAIAEKLKHIQDKCIVIINKMDLEGFNSDGHHEFLDAYLPEITKDRRFEISSHNRDGKDNILNCLYNMAPEGDPLYPEEYYTDQDMNFRISEIIREKAINRLRQELPHSIYVEIADMEFKDTPNGKKLWVRAFIITERESQKGMIVGKGGEKIKAIGEAARKELNSIFDWRVELDLRVKTGKDWRHNDRLLKKITG